MRWNKDSNHFRHAVTLVLAALILDLAVPRIAHPAPELINYQGELMDSAGSPLNGTVSLVFKIYNQQTGGTTLWQETHNTIQVQEGIFSVLLGSVSPFPATLFEGDSRWLGIKVGSDPEMTPRSRITSVAYAVRAEKANEAETATYAATAGSAPADDDWDVSGANVYIPSGNVGIGTNAPTSALHVYKSAGETNVTIESNSGDAKLHIDGGDASVDFKHYGVSKGEIGLAAGGDFLFLQHGGYVTLKDGKLGVMENDPQEELDLFGNFRIHGRIMPRDSTGLLIADENKRVRMTIKESGVNILRDIGDSLLQVSDNGNVGIGTTSPDSPLHVKKLSGNYDAKIETDAGQVDLVLDGTSGNQTVTFQQNGSFRGSVGYDTGNGYLFLYEDGKVVLDNGKLGVGTDSPTETLEVNGSVKVTGQCYGTFPRPAYDSGWVALSAPGLKTLTHNIGGNVDNYVVDMSMKDAEDTGITIFGYGTDSRNMHDVIELRGAYYCNLTSTRINIHRGHSDTTADYVRIRIWTYN